MVKRSIATDIRDVARLRRGFQGQILLPEEGAYHQARQVWNAMVDRRPAIITRCTSPADVAAAVGFARARDLEIGVRCGGHSVLGLSVPEAGLMIDLSLLRSVRVDPDRRRAWVAGGALLGDFDRAAQPFGLASTAGNISHTGVGGLTLGGGMGWLARQHGLACDNVARFQVVTADGELLHASESEDPDLYWGLRGGGGNFGVVTEFEFTLHRVGTAALLVDLFYAPQDAPAVLRRWRDLIAEAPPEATLTAWVGTTGPWPFLPAELHGRPLASVGYVWVGDPDQGRGLLPALRDEAPTKGERIQELTYLELQTMDDDHHRHGLLRRYYRLDKRLQTTSGRSPMLRQVAEGVLIHQSELLQNNAVVVQGRAGVLLIDPGIRGSEMVCLANDLRELGQPVVAGFSTHPDWDHVLWHAELGEAPRYGTARCAASMRDLLSNVDWKARVAEGLPPEIAEEIPLDLFGLITGLPAEAAQIPWDGPEVRIIEHPAHAQGHAALLIEERGVLVAGDMLSDILIPFPDLDVANPIEDYLVGLRLLEGVADDVDVLIPGHGSVGGADQVRARIEQDRAYVHALRDGHAPDDPRIGPSATYGKDWLPGVYEWQAQQLAEKRKHDKTRG